MSDFAPLPTFDTLHAWAGERTAPVTVAVAGGADRTVLEALAQARVQRWARPRFAGPGEALRRLAGEIGIEISSEEIVDTGTPAAAAVRMVHVRDAQLVMKGSISTPTLLKAILDPTHGLRTDKVIGQLVLMEIVPARRRFLLVDTGICIQPTLEQKADLLRSAVAAARSLGCPRPRVAVMAATETVTDAMPETQDAVALQKLGNAGAFGDCAVHGPLSFDLAYAPDAADKKHVGGPVVGAADVMLFPNLAAANLTVKAIMYTADCRFGGVLVGTSRPVVFMSRADTTATRLNSLALALRLLPKAT